MILFARNKYIFCIPNPPCQKLWGLFLRIIASGAFSSREYEHWTCLSLRAHLCSVTDSQFCNVSWVRKETTSQQFVSCFISRLHFHNRSYLCRSAEDNWKFGDKHGRLYMFCSKRRMLQHTGGFQCHLTQLLWTPRSIKLRKTKSQTKRTKTWRTFPQCSGLSSMEKCCVGYLLPSEYKDSGFRYQWFIV